MILPIVLYGNSVLRKVSEDVKFSEELQEFVKNLWETMYAANGVGLASNQVGKAWRVFVVDASVFYVQEKEDVLVQDREIKELQKIYKKVFINPKLILLEGEKSLMEEGCLSIPNIYAKVERPTKISLSYWDEQEIFHENEIFEGWMARAIQHEYDHIEGKLFLDYLSILKREMLSKKIEKIRKGEVKVSYLVSV